MGSASNDRKRKIVSGSEAGDSHTQSALVARLKDLNDREAWEAFEHFYGPILYRFARARGLGHFDAEEVRSACYLSVVRQIGELQYRRERGRFRNWLLTIAARRVHDASRNRRMRQPESGILDDLSSSEPSPETVWDEHWRQQQMLEALRRVEQRLGEQSRQVFRRIARDQQPSQTIAEELSISTNQVYKTRQRALAMLREELEFVRANPLTSA